MIDLGAKLGIVQKSGAWFNYGDIRLGQGRDNAKLYLKEHPDVAAEIEKQVRENADRLLAAGKGTVKPLEKPAVTPLLLKMPCRSHGGCTQDHRQRDGPRHHG